MITKETHRAPVSEKNAVLVRCREVGRIFDSGGRPLAALSGVSCEIHAGEMVCVAGPSGSGKSTLLHLVGGLDLATSGTVEVAGSDLADLDRHQRALFRRRYLGFVFQAFNLVEVLTAAENVEYPLLLAGCAKEERRRRTAAALAAVGLAGYGERPVHRLSGGEQQRVAIARALVGEPRLILADEPTANLDSRTGAAIIDLFARANRDRGTTILFSSHDPRIIGRAHRVLRLEDGRLVGSSSGIP